MKKFIRIFSIIFVLIISTVILQACSGNNNNNDNADSVVTLTLNNYQEYFTLQEEIIDYSENPYIKDPGNFSMMKATQTTKFSILLLKSNIEFDNLIIKIENDTWDGSYNVPGYDKHYRWEGNGGILRVSYNGQGSITLYATYDDYDGYYFRPMQYAVSEISGNVIIK